MAFLVCDCQVNIVLPPAIVKCKRVFIVFLSDILKELFTAGRAYAIKDLLFNVEF